MVRHSVRSALSRRQFAALLGLTGAAACSPAGTETAAVSESAPSGEAFSRPLGAQLYTLRSVLPDNPRQVLEGLAKIGYTEVEVLQAAFPDQKALLAELGLKPVSMHLDAAGILGGPDSAAKLDAGLKMAVDGGLEYVVMPYLPPDKRGGVEVYKNLAKQLQSAGEKAKALGLGFCYHNHAFEFEPMDGVTPLEILLAETDEGTVQLELDVFWVKIAGADPVTQLEKHAGRVPLIHLKDPAPGLAPQYNERVPPETFKEVGNGSIDFVPVLRAAEDAGVRHYFVEQDQTAGDPLDSLTQSYQHLRSLRV